MSRRLTALLLPLVLIGAGQAAAQEVPPLVDTATARTEVDRAILESAARIQQGISEDRGLPFHHDVQKAVLTREELAGAMLEQLADEEAKEDLRTESLLLRAVGALTEAEDLSAIYTSILTAMVQGYYDPDEKYLRCVSTSSTMIQNQTMVHELYHALQDQHFALTGFMEGEELTSDRARARQAVVEGEAEFFTARYMAKNPQLLGGDPMEGMGEMLLQQLSIGSIPVYFLDSSMWPYLAGNKFIDAVYEQGGWDAVAALYENPPVSSEQIVHPEKFLAGEMPREVSLQLPTWATEGGYQEQARETLGQATTFDLVHELSGDAMHAMRGSIGWGGDTVLVAQDEQEQLLFLWRTVWDSEKDALEFHRAWRRSAEKELMKEGVEFVRKWEADHTGDALKLSVRVGRKNGDTADAGSLAQVPPGVAISTVDAEGELATWIVRRGDQVMVARGPVLAKLDPVLHLMSLLDEPLLEQGEASRRRRAY